MLLDVITKSVVYLQLRLIERVREQMTMYPMSSVLQHAYGGVYVCVCMCSSLCKVRLFPFSLQTVQTLPLIWICQKLQPAAFASPGSPEMITGAQSRVSIHTLLIYIHSHCSWTSWKGVYYIIIFLLICLHKHSLSLICVLASVAAFISQCPEIDCVSKGELKGDVVEFVSGHQAQERNDNGGC